MSAAMLQSTLSAENPAASGLTFGTIVSTGLKPEKNPILSTPVSSYGIHGYPYSARTTLWLSGKKLNSITSPLFARTTSGTNVKPPFATSTVCVIGPLVEAEADLEELEAAEVVVGDDSSFDCAEASERYRSDRSTKLLKDVGTILKSFSNNGILIGVTFSQIP